MDDNDAKPMTVSIKDVARHAGVSPSTVSRALGRGPISEPLRQQVEAAVRETGYRPNLSARRLRSRESGTVGLILADIGNPFFTALTRAVEDAAYQAGLRVILCNTGEDAEREAMYLRLMQEERVSGVIFAPTLAYLDHPPQSPLDFPVVLVDRAGPQGLYDSVVLDNEAACATLVDHFHARGYRRINGLFGKTSATGVERRRGYDDTMRAYGLEPKACAIAPHAEAAEVAVSRWLSEPEPPEAIVASNSLLLIGALRAVRRAWLRLPDDIALAGFDNELWTELVEPGMTVIEQPIEAIGRAAMSLLRDRMADPTLPPRQIVLKGRAIIRGSSAPALDERSF
ncbi:LacI family transcription regulator [Rhodospirillum rubrum F11]|uniref:Transcriptional regulator, LacI family n=2 Tax=Rhodospirillum rubrum TaxID=1085 RepID=Q2RSX2_RHORT|nr:substrate-binding domain-containing protein [Rhodospirillum rubrum]ABC22773.1 transcriptional regulator, LacI family [Rhodospirillum rubrum ATCC 11170]AEO48494.1 LacI family transcription regulator [Rhodospirillum rubrum F11]MBK5954370.1 LacI family transcriptional regulator [Rhodospirillum rubrum]QXG78762.1 substrate-binding domain-containing protein [Rhodospirillum rubrum]HCF19304.1 LacI family DNA-binding transcriptional regulator [Rhodospirillum rubrum]